jgi:lysyl endopeptidase
MRRFLLILAASAALFAASANAELPRVAGEPAWVNEKAAAAQSAARKVRLSDAQAADVAHVRFAPIAESRIYDLRLNNAQAVNKAMQVGIHRDLREEGMAVQQPALKWRPLPDGGGAARFAVTSPGAVALRLGLNFRNIAPGAELRFLGVNDHDSVVAVVKGEEIAQLRREQPLYWTPVTEGESQIVEIYLPADAPSRPRFSVDSVSHLIVAPWGKLAGAKIGESDTCEVDVACISPPPAGFTNAKNAVARMTFTAGCGTGGALATCLCTGTLLNDTDTNTQIPYFYGANHCISTQTEASSLTTFWFYEATGCRTGVLGTNTQVAGGGTLLYADHAKDGMFMRLNNAPPAGSYFGGWDPNTVSANTAFTVIHHPSGDVKKVSLGQILGFSTLSDPGGNFIAVGYTNATTEGGSSGSGILTSDSSGAYFLRGGLLGGPATCATSGNLSDTSNRDYYSRFDQVYPSISQYLAPAATQPDYSGAWSNANENGWGLSIVRGPSSGLYGIIMYHYNQSASPTWYWMSGGSFSGNTYSAPITQYSGPYFGGPYNSNLVTAPVVGSATINFTSATTATYSYTISGTSVSKSITKLAF